MEYLPDFSLLADGSDITRAIRRGLQDIRLTDYGGATGKTDTLTITLTSATLPLPTQGARLQLGLGFNGELVDKGSYVVCGVESSGPPRTVTITATAAPGNSRKHTGDTTAQRHRTFEHTTLGDIVRTVAQGNALTPRVAASLAGIPVSYEVQNGESDGAFMLRLAKRYNALSKPANGQWLFLAQGSAIRASGKPVGARTLTPADVSRWSYREGNRGQVKAGDGKKKGKVGIHYFDDATGETKTHTREINGADIHHPHTHPDKDTAVQAASAAVSQAEKNGRQMSLSGPVRPDLIRLTAEGRITTQGFGLREDHTWQVESVTFTLGASGFTFDFSLKTDISPAGKKANQKKKQGIDYGF